ncbi:MAG TPA: hypothetical protein VJI75_04130 [Candidatus Nanoarchaeia archaeon]|nr:hypothetical protein [Candidatus Nanoarchaeia archaeon]
MSTLTERIDNLLQSIYERTSDSKLEKNCDEIIAQKKLQPLEAERYYIFRELNVGAAGVGGICSGVVGALVGSLFAISGGLEIYRSADAYLADKTFLLEAGRNIIEGAAIMTAPILLGVTGFGTGTMFGYLATRKGRVNFMRFLIHKYDQTYAQTHNIPLPKGREYPVKE